MAEIDLGKVTFGKEELRAVIDQIISEYSPRKVDVLGSFSTSANSSYTINALLSCKYSLCFFVVVLATTTSSAGVTNITVNSDEFALISVYAGGYAKVFVGYNENISLVEEGSEYSVTVTVSATNTSISRNGFLFGVR